MNEQSVREDILKILRLLSSEDAFSQRDLSSLLGISLGKTNYLLKSLSNKGIVKIRNFTATDNKLQKIKYILTKKGFEEKLRLTFFFLKKKEEEYLLLKKEAEMFSNKISKEDREIITENIMKE